MKKKIIKIILLTCIFTFVLPENFEKHVIGTRAAGFFSNFLGAINHLFWCDNNKKIPVVYWDKTSYYYQKTYDCLTTNVWEYYFEPVSEVCYIESDTIDTNYEAPDRFAIRGFSKEEFIGNFDIDFRLSIYSIIEKYIKIKPEIRQKIQEFYNYHMAGKKTIGIHIRRTDKYTEAIPVSLKNFIKTAKKFKKYQFFIATDEYQILEQLKKKFKDRVIYYNSHRSCNGAAIHTDPFFKSEKSLLGQEVLIEAQLLSLCDVFIHSNSNVALAVLFFNPWLKNIYLEEKHHKKKFWRYFKTLFK